MRDTRDHATRLRSLHCSLLTVGSDYSDVLLDAATHIDRVRARVTYLEELVREWEEMTRDEIETERDALRARVAELEAVPSSWIATHTNGKTLHFSRHDGWIVEPVALDPKP